MNKRPGRTPRVASRLSRRGPPRPSRTAADHYQRVLLELQVHQEELDQQNAQLRATQEELELARDRLADLYDLAPLPYLTLNHHGIILEANQTCLSFFGLAQDRLIGRPLYTLVPMSSHSSLRLALDRRRPGRPVVETRLQAAAGEAPVELHVRPVADGTRYIAIVDLSERERSAAEKRALLLQAEVARASSAAKDQFLANISHELRTPLTPVVMAASGLQPRAERASLGADEMRTFLALVLRCLAYEARLIDDLLDISRLSVGKLTLETQDLDLHEVLREAMGLIAEEAKRKGIQCQLDLRARRHRVRGDALRLRQVFWNLLRNAVKFTPGGGTVTVRSRNDRRVVVVEVRDTGVGIAPADLPLIFDRFSQTAAGARAGGLGIGLAIVRGITEAHGGRVTATSPGPGRGASFTLELSALPRQAPTAPTGPTAPGPPPEPSPAGRTGLRILLVEDHEETAAILAQLLRGQGYQVEVAHNVADALAAAGRGLDLLISDIGLPDGSGVDLLTRLRRRMDVPAIALTGYGQQDDVTRSRAAGFTQHLVKPVPFPSLLRVIREVSGERAAASAEPGRARGGEARRS